MELHQIRYFLALAQTLNFTRAAEQCHVTQPALTKAVQRLEQELGGVLIHRERQLTQLTDLGRVVLPMLQRASAAAEAARVSATEYQRKEVAPLRILLTPCISAALVETPLAQIGSFLPGLQVELADCDPEDVTRRLLSGEAHCAVSCDIRGVVPDRIDAWLLFEEELVVLAPARGRFKGTGSIALAELSEAPWLDLVGEGCSVARIWPALFGDDTPARIAHRGPSLVHLQHMVSAGLGFMFAPSHTEVLPNVTKLRVEGRPLRSKVQLMAVAGRCYPPALEAFIKVARLQDWAPTIARPYEVEMFSSRIAHSADNEVAANA